MAARVREAELSGAPALRVDKLDAFYGKSHILSDISFEARKGEVVAVLGRNGAGKSTLLKSMLGLARIGSGSIHIAGQSIASPVPEAIDRKRVVSGKSGSVRVDSGGRRSFKQKIKRRDH